jgi:hypothetical protein
MFNISSFLDKFLNLEKDSELKKEIIIEEIKKHTGIEIKYFELETDERFIKIKTNPVFRNEIYMHKSKIEEKLRERKIFLLLK